MPRVLIVYGSTDGHVTKIAEKIAEVIREQGCEPELWPCADLKGQRLSLEGFDAIVIGDSIHVGKHHGYVQRFVSDHREQLNDRVCAFFSVSGTSASDQPDMQAQARGYVEEFLARTGWRPAHTELIAGAFPFSQYGLLKRWIMRGVVKRQHGIRDPSGDIEFTDWEQVRRFAEMLAGLARERSGQV
jgi:menaquinone-dependent protoporphyrinogen oxidase